MQIFNFCFSFLFVNIWQLITAPLAADKIINSADLLKCIFDLFVAVIATVIINILYRRFPLLFRTNKHKH